MKSPLTHFTNHDGSRHFASLPERCIFTAFRHHTASLPGAVITNYLAAEPVEMWLDFTLAGHTFTINNQFGEYWFFVTDPACPDAILTRIVEHFESLLL